MVILEAFDLWHKNEVMIMLSEILKVDKSRIYNIKNDELSVENEAKLLEWIDKRKNKYPLQYILGKWDFYNLELKLNENTLIPRPETELFVELLLQRIKENEKILEIGVGTGAISLALKSNMSSLNIYGVDISEKALEIAKTNSKVLGLDVEFSYSDVYSKMGIKSFDWIISNPPYINLEDYMNLEKELYFEPKEALLGGDNGLEIYTRIIEDANTYLNDNGQIALEIGYNQGRPISLMLEENGFIDIEVIKDYSDFDRFIFAKKDLKGKI